MDNKCLFTTSNMLVIISLKCYTMPTNSSNRVMLMFANSIDNRYMNRDNIKYLLYTETGVLKRMNKYSIECKGESVSKGPIV